MKKLYIHNQTLVWLLSQPRRIAFGYGALTLYAGYWLVQFRKEKSRKTGRLIRQIMKREKRIND